MAHSAHDTPAMRQFRRFKQQHPDCLLLFRMGDFYELFYDDAKAAAKAIGLTLTQRTQGIPMAGVPYHQLDTYLRRLLQAGFRVAVAEQTEDAAQAKGVVKRDVSRVVTPGTLTDESLLDEARANPLAAVQFIDDQHAAIALAELSTGAFSVAALGVEALGDELTRLGPTELLYVETADGNAPPRVKQLAEAVGCSLTPRPAWQFRPAEALEALCKQFQVATLAGFGLADDAAVIGPAGAVVAYLLQTQRAVDGRLAHLRPPRRIEPAQHLVIDAMALRSLEIERTMRSGEVSGSLLGTLNACRTAMGKRAMRQWLCYPLRDRARIAQRQRIVGAIVEDPSLDDDLCKAFDQVQDVQRIAGRLAVGRLSPRDLVALGKSAGQVESIAELLAERPALKAMHEELTGLAPPLRKLAEQLREACVEDPPAHLRAGGLIRDGYDAPLDEQRSLQRDANSWLARYQKQLIDETGIDRLKVGYNKVFGYYIEVSAAQAGRMPDRFTRKQTLKNAERYITPQLKEFENNVLGAESKAIARENKLLGDLIATAGGRLDELQRFAEIIAAIDVLACFARRAVKFGYVRPTLVDEPVLHIDAGRHPVLDELLADQFVPNDVALGSDAGSPADAAARAPSSLALITGPNMAGKSTYIRQTALLVLMAHTGSFVPAASATIGLTDRIFTRIGASDELHAGQSTFMVEMVETANICHHATAASLVILDEIGRGTSTLDGLSLAWAIAEHLAQQRCRTLFATHYHEVTQLAEAYPNVTNLNVAVREWADEVVFLHRIQPGATDRSYGIHVAKIAGLPARVVARAGELMNQFQLHTSSPTPSKPSQSDAPAPSKPSQSDAPAPSKPSQSEAAARVGVGAGSDGPAPPPRAQPQQPTLFTQYMEHPATQQLRQADLDALSPLQAFDLLRKIQEELNGR